MINFERNSVGSMISEMILCMKIYRFDLYDLMDDFPECAFLFNLDISSKIKREWWYPLRCSLMITSISARINHRFEQSCYKLFTR